MKIGTIIIVITILSLTVLTAALVVPERFLTETNSSSFSANDGQSRKLDRATLAEKMLQSDELMLLEIEEDERQVLPEGMPLRRDQIIAEVSASLSPSQSAALVGAQSFEIVRSREGAWASEYQAEACPNDMPCEYLVRNMPSGRVVFDGIWTDDYYASPASDLVVKITE